MLKVVFAFASSGIGNNEYGGICRHRVGFDVVKGNKGSDEV